MRSFTYQDDELLRFHGILCSANERLNGLNETREKFTAKKDESRHNNTTATTSNKRQRNNLIRRRTSLLLPCAMPRTVSLVKWIPFRCDCKCEVMPRHCRRSMVTNGVHRSTSRNREVFFRSIRVVIWPIKLYKWFFFERTSPLDYLLVSE